MNKSTLASLLAGLGLLLIQTPSFAGVAFPFSTGNQYVQGEVLVKFKPQIVAATRAQMAQIYGTQAMQAIGNQPDLVLAKLTPGQTVEQAVGAYNNDLNVAYAQPNYIYHTQAIPTDPQYGQLWAAKNSGQTIATSSYTPATGTSGNDMKLESAWNVQTDCSTVVVAVVDSGVNYNSTDLAANMWTGNAMHGQNFAADGAAGDPMDLAGHGTHVAGIIGAVGGNGIGGVGVCWKANIMAVRVMDATGSGTSISIIAGINYAVSNGAKVINMSLGGAGGIDQAYSDAITSAQTAGVLVVVAAGNDGVDNDTTPHWPCNFTHSNLICVGALDQNYALAGFSNWGATSVDVGAPGTNIYSTWAGTNATITDPLNAGWLGSSTTTGGGWFYSTIGSTQFIVDSSSYPSGQYNNSTDDRAYKTFNLAGVNVALLQLSAAINVRNGDHFRVGYASAGGDPFAGGGVIAGDVTNMATFPSISSATMDISGCISVSCRLGFQMQSDASLTDIGVGIAGFSIKTLTLNTTSYNTIDGTSMATPEVAGVAALVWAHNPLYTYADVANAIKSGGRAIPALSGKTTSGKAVDAMGALAYINPPTGIVVVVH